MHPQAMWIAMGASDPMKGRVVKSPQLNKPYTLPAHMGLIFSHFPLLWLHFSTHMWSDRKT